VGGGGRRNRNRAVLGRYGYQRAQKKKKASSRGTGKKGGKAGKRGGTRALVLQKEENLGGGENLMPLVCGGRGKQPSDKGKGGRNWFQFQPCPKIGEKKRGGGARTRGGGGGGGGVKGEDHFGSLRHEK